MLGEHSLEKIKPNLWNPNKVDPINQEKLRKSMSTHGQAMPIVIREVLDDINQPFFEIVDGEHRYQAATELGWSAIKTLNLGECSREEAMRKTIIFNTRYGQDDNSLLFELLSTDGVFADTQEILDTLPIDETELLSIFGSEDIDFGDLDDDLESVSSGQELDVGSEPSQARPHRILRFKLSNEDADTVEETIERIRAEQGFSDSDAMTNAGDALIFLLNSEK